MLPEQREALDDLRAGWGSILLSSECGTRLWAKSGHSIRFPSSFGSEEALLSSGEVCDLYLVLVYEPVSGVFSRKSAVWLVSLEEFLSIAMDAFPVAYFLWPKANHGTRALYFPSRIFWSSVVSGANLRHWKPWSRKNIQSFVPQIELSCECHFSSWCPNNSTVTLPMTWLGKCKVSFPSFFFGTIGGWLQVLMHAGQALCSAAASSALASQSLRHSYHSPLLIPFSSVMTRAYLRIL